VTARVHHSAIVVHDIEASLRFWRDGVGFRVLMDMHVDGDWRALFGAPENRLRSLFLGDPDRSDAGIVELVQFEGSGNDAAEPAPAMLPARSPGFFLVSCYVDVDEVLERLRTLGLGGQPRRISVPSPRGDVQMATVVDPDGVLVELIAIPAS
jgi:catechol 2,3-dioxygenase-like lactoylglutathione lyase family enzyme